MDGNDKIKKVLKMDSAMEFRAGENCEASFDATVQEHVVALAKACHAAGLPLVCAVQVGPTRIVRVFLLPDGSCEPLMAAGAALAPDDFVEVISPVGMPS